MSEIITNSGRTPRPQKSESKSTPAPKPQEASSQKSSLPHSKKLNPTQSDVLSVSDKKTAVSQLLGSGAPTVGGSAASAAGEKEQPNAPSKATAPSTEAASVADGLPPSDAGDVPQSDPANGAGSETLAALPETYDVKLLAEQLGVEPKDLYDKLQVTTQDGETLTFGEMKDRVTTNETATRAQIARETQIDQRESAMLETLHLLDSVGANVKQQFPDAAKALSEYGQQKRERERQSAIKAMPELADQAYRAQFRDDVAEHMSGYGFRSSELNIMDHRILLALKDAIKTKKQLAKLLEFDPNADPTPPKVQRPQGKRPRLNTAQKLTDAAARSGQKGDQVAAVGALLRGK